MICDRLIRMCCWCGMSLSSNKNMSVDDEYIQGNRVAKAKFFGFLTLLVILYLYVEFFYLVPATSLENKEEMDKYLSRLFFGWSIYAALSWVGAFWFIRFALKIKQAGCYPPLDSVVPFKTKIQRNHQYVKFAWLSTLFFATMLALNPLLRLYVLYQLSELVETLN